MSQGNSLPWKKSCNACIKAKRRCDLLTPQCTRCFQKNLECVYKGQLPGWRHSPADSPANSISAPQDHPLVRPTAAYPSIQPESAFTELPGFNFDATSFDLPVDFDPGLVSMNFMPSLPIPSYSEGYATSYPEGYTATNTMEASYSASTSVYSGSDHDPIGDICVCAPKLPLSMQES